MAGGFPLMSDIKRRTIRAPVNPMDKSTVVSIFPKDVPPEIKPTIQPGVFKVGYGTYEKPFCLVVGPSSWWKELDENQPLLEIPQSSIVIADSIVKDWANGIFAVDLGENMPGWFYLPGEWTSAQVLAHKQAELDEANRKQRNWYQVLIKIADAMWARTNGNPLSISEDMRLAARELNLVNKEWIADQQVIDLVRCKACGNLKNPLYPVCANCKAIDDPAKAKELGLVFAQ